MRKKKWLWQQLTGQRCKDVQTQQTLYDLAVFSALAANKTLRLCGKKEKDMMMQNLL